MDLKLLWVDVMEIVWVTILSKVANEDKDAARASKEALEEAAILQDSFVAAMSGDVTAMANTVTMMKGYDDDDDDKGGAPDDAMIVQQQQQQQQALPMQVLAACWPLIAMWPVLYGSYQVEKLLGLEV